MEERKRQRVRVMGRLKEGGEEECWIWFHYGRQGQLESNPSGEEGDREEEGERRRRDAEIQSKQECNAPEKAIWSWLTQGSAGWLASWLKGIGDEGAVSAAVDIQCPAQELQQRCLSTWRSLRAVTHRETGWAVLGDAILVVGFPRVPWGWTPRAIPSLIQTNESASFNVGPCKVSVSPPISSEIIDTSPEPTLRQEEEIVKANRGNDRRQTAQCVSGSDELVLVPVGGVVEAAGRGFERVLAGSAGGG
ncbi:hypothetical protein F7725_007860 [Dissostichus mawsoni]|uniref:Uncharacterized protein n=1 Tax=Dissostichus mawsoni TaxID=36200 RepID=A0A7J5Y7S9_DISMA|nr:hypothetical protein F7725_007860 [Dissostichus mawsoni]